MEVKTPSRDQVMLERTQKMSQPSAEQAPKILSRLLSVAFRLGLLKHASKPSVDLVKM